MQPNTHAAKHLNQVTDRLGKTVAEFSSAKTKHHECAAQFEAVREKRLNLFNECYAVVAKEINGIYKDLTKSALHPAGGTAHLTLQDDAEPFLGGLTYTAMPPSKVRSFFRFFCVLDTLLFAHIIFFCLHYFKTSYPCRRRSASVTWISSAAGRKPSPRSLLSSPSTRASSFPHVTLSRRVVIVLVVAVSGRWSVQNMGRGTPVRCAFLELTLCTPPSHPLPPTPPS